MKYSFITRSIVKSDKNNFANKWTLVGIISLFIAMVLELLINQKFGFVFVVPLIYLFSLYSHSGGSENVQDVELEVNFHQFDVSLLYKDVIIKKKTVLSQLYIVGYKKINKIVCDSKNGIIYLLADADLQLIDKDNNIVKNKFEKDKRFVIYIPCYYYETLSRELSEKTGIKIQHTEH